MGLIDKLRLDTDKQLVLIEPTDDSITLFEGLDLKTNLAGKGPLHQVILFALNKAVLDTYYPKIINRLAENAIFWIAYPKKSSGISSDLLRDEGWRSVMESDYQIVTSVSINDSWTGMRIKMKDPDATYKREVPMQERKTTGIDYVKRTVKLPKDAVAVMKPYKGLEDFFYTMSFSHTREYIESIEEAKKPETRQRRIEKMVEMVSKLREQKELKKKKV